MLLAREVDNHVGDNTYRDTLRYAVKQRHSDDAKICGDRGSEIVHIKLYGRDIGNHKEADYDKRRCGRERGDRGKHRCKEHRNKEEESGSHSRKTCSAASGNTR